jgi:hypothetical protein
VRHGVRQCQAGVEIGSQLCRDRERGQCAVAEVHATDNPRDDPAGRHVRRVCQIVGVRHQYRSIRVTEQPQRRRSQKQACCLAPPPRADDDQARLDLARLGEEHIGGLAG